MSTPRETELELANATLQARIVELGADLAALRADLTDLLVLAKSWSIVWGDKISPKSLEMFQEVESRILARAALKKEAKP